MPATEYLAKTILPTWHGEFTMYVYAGTKDQEHIALTVGDIADHSTPVMVRVHSECLTGDIFGSNRCDCGEQLNQSMELLQRQGRGVLLYLRQQEGRGIGLTNKIRAYALQDQGLDTVDANRALGLPDDLRDYSDAVMMLRDLGVQQVALLTNNPAKIVGLEHHGIVVVERIPLPVEPNPWNLRYLQTKQERMGHLLTPLSQRAAAD